MQMIKLLLILCLPMSVFSQNTIGLPDVINYSKQVYSAGFQNWDIKQDKNGIVYVANNEGLLTYDGKTWKLFPLPNKTIVRSVEIGEDNRIYVGGQDELGYFTPDLMGRLQYHSITKFISAKDKSFGDVWDIVSLQKDIFFRSTTKLFRLTNESIATFNAPSEWSYLGICNNKIYAHDNAMGLMKYENAVLIPLQQQNVLPKSNPITGILGIGNNSALITTLKNGLFILTDSGISKLITINNPIFENARIYGAISINSERVALATNNNGIYIIDLKGNIVQSFSRTEGLQNNNVLSVFLDNQGNLWLGLDNGIDLVSYNSAIKQVNPLLRDGSGYAAIIFKSQLFIGTSNGLYSVPLEQMNDLSFSKGSFTLVNNTTGQNWALANINNQLLLGHHEGAFVIREKIAIPISVGHGFWNFVPLSNTFPSEKTLAGNYRGLFFFNYINQQFVQTTAIPGFDESSRFVALDKYENIWVSHPYHGVYKISKKSDGSFSIIIYTDKNGLPSALNNHVYKIKNEIVIATEKGVFVYNERKNNFESSPFYKNILGAQSLRFLKEDLSGNIWFIHEKTLGVIDLSGKEPKVIYLPELNNKMLSGFEFIYPVDKNNIFLSGEKGFFHINYEKYKQMIPNLQVQIRNVRIISKTDSLLFGGYFKDINEKQIQDANQMPEIKSDWKSILFYFSSTDIGHEANLEYSFRLKGYDKTWSEWTKKNEKEYTNMPEGKYTFEVKVRNNFGTESLASSYSFIMLPPWYLATWAKFLYVLLFAMGLFIIFKWQQKKFKLQQLKYEYEQKNLLYIHDLELSKTESELVALRNEKLEAEINHKNSELASSAMHLVKKGELFSKIKGELTQVMKGLDNPQAITELKKMIKSLSEDDNMDNEWENFTKHFDKVHSDFVKGLKEMHPTITGNELKLCAYLRMNLSTKEIAQLMNISVRGVEISRYRLRKKLQLSSDINLFDYLINILSTTS